MEIDFEDDLEPGFDPEMQQDNGWQHVFPFEVGDVVDKVKILGVASAHAAPSRLKYNVAFVNCGHPGVVQHYDIDIGGLSGWCSSCLKSRGFSRPPGHTETMFWPSPKSMPDAREFWR